MYIDYEKLGEKLGFGKDFFYELKVKQNLTYIKKNQKQVLKKLKNKTPLNVIFYVYDETKWKSQSVYDLMEKDERFNPIVVVTKNCCAIEENPNFQTVEDVKKCYKFFKSKGMNVEYGYNINPHLNNLQEDVEDRFIPLESFTPDIIFYSHPWYVYKTQGPVMCSKFALTFYIPYFLPASEQWHEYGLRFHKYIYRHFVPTELIKDFYSKNMEENKESLKVVGHPAFDYYLNHKNKKPEYLIYAPHWTVCGNNLRFGTFDWSGNTILNFAKNHKELNWVFRPHPLMHKFILTSGFMTKKEINNYFDEWKSFAKYSDDGNYIDLFQKSYAMITDCGSFLTEYFVTENPMIHLISSELKENSTISEIDKTNYTAHNLEELNQHLNDLILNKNDYKKEARIKLLNKLNLKNNYSAERIVEDIFTI